eukprot:TRINITY_DN292_c0_g1_i1.p1 TRINITY_DN292_c0_g1~~TRINITY_DN292_c0_g1_i1.p1  ORF type:complete len:458 (+),score=80.62 TRINITY_DN292_c0_g1_i1:70-1443(+)
MDIGLFRAGKGGNPDLVRESQRRRYASLEDVDKVIELDERWRKLRYESEVANKAFKDVSKEVGRLKQTNPNTDVTELIEKSNAFKEASLTAGRLESEVLQQRDELLYTIGNLVHHSVPVSKDEANNEVVRIWGENRPSTPDLKHHHELLYMIAGYEPKIGADVAGHRGYYLTGFGMLLNQALIQYAQRFLYKKGYQPVQTPFFMKQSTMKKVAALAEFHEALYKVEGDEEEPYYLIATSEQPICALNMGKTFNDKELPLKYSGLSTCFRKEAGGHGRDVWGIFRVHQFEKVEQFVVCSPDKSWDVHEELIQISEEFYRSLGLSYHVVNIVSGELNNAASKKYDLEAWFPTLGTYRELVSCSNCTDYQSRRLDIKFGYSKAADGSIRYVHMLNSTLCATERTICCILENYQCEKGIKVPEVLKPYLQFALEDLTDPDVIPFVRGPPPIGKGAKGQDKK